MVGTAIPVPAWGERAGLTFFSKQSERAKSLAARVRAPCARLLPLDHLRFEKFLNLFGSQAAAQHRSFGKFYDHVRQSTATKEKNGKA